MTVRKSERRTFRIRGEVWRYPGPAGWFFVNLGRQVAEDIRLFEDLEKVGWGYVKVEARVGRTKWDTTLFPTKEKEFLLALKASVRKSEGIREGDLLDIEFTLPLPGQAPGSPAKNARKKIVRPMRSRSS